MKDYQSTLTHLYFCILSRNGPSHGTDGTPYWLSCPLVGSPLPGGLVHGSCSILLRFLTGSNPWQNARTFRSYSTSLNCRSCLVCLHRDIFYCLGTTWTYGRHLRNWNKWHHCLDDLCVRSCTLRALSGEVASLATLIAPTPPICHWCWTEYNIFIKPPQILGFFPSIHNPANIFSTFFICLVEIPKYFPGFFHAYNLNLNIWQTALSSGAKSLTGIFFPSPIKPLMSTNSSKMLYPSNDRIKNSSIASHLSSLQLKDPSLQGL